MRNLIRFTPRHDLNHLQHEIDRLFEGLFPAGSNNDEQPTMWTPRVDLAETDAAYTIHVDVPGLGKDDLAIDIHEGVLTISGERKAEEKTDKANYVRVERLYGHFRRSFTLPKAVQEDAVVATYKEGVLTVDVPKAEEVKPRRIAIS